MSLTWQTAKPHTRKCLNDNQRMTLKGPDDFGVLTGMLVEML
jgi:hypothetical protein